MNVKEIAISKFKTTCLAVIDDVNRTGAPVRVTRFGKPVAEIRPITKKRKKSWIGCMEGSVEIVGDIVGPIGAFGDWPAVQK